MRRVGILAAFGLIVGLMGLTGCSALSGGGKQVFSYGPCSTQEGCFDATYPMADAVGGDLAGDCVAANTAAAADLMAEAADNPEPHHISVESTKGDCRVAVEFSASGSLTGKVYDMR